jgi:hypothetical protein
VSGMVLLVWVPLTDYLSNLFLSVRLLKFFIIMQASKKSLDPVAPLHKYGVVSISNILTTTCQYEVGFVLVLYLFCHLCCFVLLIYWICNVIISGPQVCQFPCPNACQMCEDDTCDGNICYTLTSAVKSNHLSIHLQYVDSLVWCQSLVELICVHQMLNKWNIVW